MYIVGPPDRGIHWASAWEDLLIFGDGVVSISHFRINYVVKGGLYCVGDWRAVALSVGLLRVQTGSL